MKLTAPISILLLLFYSCANMVAPSGGIKDTTAPILLSVTENKTTTINEFHFIFNEYIQLNNWEDNFYISPPFNKKLQKKIKGETLIISIKDSLTNNTTYHLSLSNCIKDLNEGNITDSLSFIFGNPNHFDTLTLNGTLRDAYTLEAIKNAWIMLFNKDKHDTLIFKDSPNYIAKTNKDGNFNFPNMNDKNYKIAALTDFDFIYHKNELIAFSNSIINAKKDSFISLFAFDPIVKTNSISADTLIMITDSTELDTIKNKQLPATGSLKLNTKQYSSIVFQLLQNEKVHYSFSFNSFPFLLNNINPGKYSLKCIIDKNLDGEWTKGSWEEKIQAEKVFNYPEEITIRSNWDLELDWDLE